MSAMRNHKKDRPSTSYTIDDLPFLESGADLDPACTRWDSIMAILASSEDEAASLARREPGTLIAHPVSNEKPRYRAELLLATVSQDARTLHILAASPFRDVRLVVAGNPATTVDTLRQLTGSDHPWIAAAATAHPTLTLGDLEFQAVVGDAAARTGILGNPHVSQHLVVRLASDPDVSVWIAAASHPRATDKILHQLASDRWWEVRAAVAGNTQAGLALHRTLAHDPEDLVRTAVAQVAEQPALLATLAHDQAPGVRTTLAASPTLPADLARQLANDPEHWVRLALARNPKTPADVLADMAVHASWETRLEIAANPTCPSTTWLRLATRDRSKAVRHQAWSHRHNHSARIPDQAKHTRAVFQR